MSKFRVLLIITVTVFCFVSTSLSAGVTRQVDFAPGFAGVQLTVNDLNGFEIDFTLGSLKLEETTTKGGLFDEIRLDDFGQSSILGEPKLPLINKIIAVPIGAKVSFDLLSSRKTVLKQSESGILHPLAPAQRSVSKSEDPALIPFEYHKSSYAKTEWTSNQLFTLNEIGYLRGVRIFQLTYQPIRYNPVTSDLEVTYEAHMRVSFEHPDQRATQDLLDRTASYEFDRLYSRTIFNWEPGDRTSLVRYPTKLLILCPPNYTSTLQPFVDWKRQQGYNVIVTTVGSGGTVTNSTSAIISYMQGVWAAATTPDPAPTYLLIVGDTSTSGDNIIANICDTDNSRVTDLTYVRLSGSDYIPEMYYGRFSVSSATELTNVINKTLMFEKTTMPDLSYLGNDIMIAGVDASYAPTYGNGQINYGTTYYFNPSNGITSNTYLYPASNGAVEAEIIGYINAGRGYINYTAHGSETGWYDPALSTSDLSAMTNTNKPFFAVGNCCVTNAFNYSSPCFGEVLIRSANKAGACYIGATNYSYWDEDYWWGIGYKTPIQAAAHPYSASNLGAYDAMFHTHGEAFTDWALTAGETVFMGNSAVQMSSSTRKPYYWEIYSIMGDPSLMPYYGVPGVNTATFPREILVGTNSITITAVPYSRVALTMGGVIYSTALVPAGGSLTLSITPFSAPGTATLVITAQNKITIQESISIIPNSGPYLSVSPVVYNDNNNNNPEYNESGALNVTYHNAGSVDAAGVNVTLTCSTSGITLTDNTDAIATLASGASVTHTSAFALNIANNISNGLNAAFTVTMVSGSYVWASYFSLVLSAPVLSFGAVTISDPIPGNNNGQLDPGETVSLSLPISNSGSAPSPSGTAVLSCSTTGITLHTVSCSFSSIVASGSTTLTFSLTASATMPIGSIAYLSFSAAAGSYIAVKNENVTLGLITEDFETGGFTSYPWTQGSYAWTVDNTTYHEGSHSAKSGSITHSQSSTLQTIRVLTSGGNLTFWYKVSSESGYDYLKFYVDGVLQTSSWSGTVDWTQATFALAPGTRTLMWEYMKDGSISSGSDCAWVDDIVFPASTIFTYPPQNPAAQTYPGLVALTWQAPQFGSPTGYNVYKDNNCLALVTTLAYNDIAVTNGVTYSYYITALYGSGESSPSATVTASPNIQYANLGSGTASTNNNQLSPINNTYKSIHGQSVYTAAEITATGISGPANLTQLGFYVVTAPNLALSNFVIRIKPTAATDASAWHTAENFVTVYSTAAYLPVAGGYNMLTFQVPFAWNGTDNLVIDTAFGIIATFSQTGTLQYSTVNNGYIRVGDDNTNQTNIFTGGQAKNIRPNIRLQMQSTRAPAISVNPVSLDFGEVNISSESSLPFTIHNSGTSLLAGNITTPDGYSVASSSSRRDNGQARYNRLRNNLPFSLEAGENRVYHLTFAPTQFQSYHGNVVITSNDTAHPSVNVAVSGSGFDLETNHKPTIVLPENVTFNKNTALQQDFTPYLFDADGDTLSLFCNSCRNLSVNISGMLVTFASSQNWFGSTFLTFRVFDGELSCTDSILVNVLPTDVPSWQPVTYGTNSATLYGVITLAGSPASTSDQIAAFVGSECRGLGSIVLNGGQTYTTLLISLASNTETVYFKLYDTSADQIYGTPVSQLMNCGDIWGDPLPYSLLFDSAVSMQSPAVSICSLPGCVRISWPVVALASRYLIYRSTNPFNGFTFLTEVTGTEFSDSETFPTCYYKVVAASAARSVGGAR